MQFQSLHEVHIRLGAAYPRMMPELAWKTPIFHPNISASGVVCLGGYGTYWVPSLTLDELCVMLWDMIRYENYDETSPYNRDAANWIKNQIHYRLPLDPRPFARPQGRLCRPDRGRHRRRQAKGQDQSQEREFRGPLARRFIGRHAAGPHWAASRASAPPRRPPALPRRPPQPK